MSTYTDLHNKAKETLNVDYCTRVTPQKVHFVNPENTYNGKFSGKIEVSGYNTIFGGTVTSVILSSSILDNVYFSNGLKIDTIKDAIDALSAGLSIESIVRAEEDYALCTEISTTNFNLDVEKVLRKNADDALSIELMKEINYQAEQSLCRDNALNDKIEAELSNRISADVELEKRVNDKMLHDRHLEMHLIDNREFPLMIHDYTINTYVDSNANAYVYINGNTESRPIGRIEKATYNEDGSIESFEFNAFANHPSTYELTGAGMFQYYFDKNNTMKYTGVGGYRINCDIARRTSLEDMQFQIDSANNNGYYNAYLKSTSIIAGTIESDLKYGEAGMISSCAITISADELSNFAYATPYRFTSNGEIKTFKGKNGNWCEAILSDNVFYFYDKHITKYYLPVLNADNNNEFGRIYDGNIILAYDGSLKEIGIYADDNKRYFLLNTDNGFKLTFNPANPYIKIIYSEVSNIIQIKEEKKYYRYDLNGNAGNLIPGKEDIPNKKIDEAYKTINATLNIDSPSLAKYVNDVYTLNLVGSTVNIYEVEKDILTDKFGKIKLTFKKDARTLDVVIMPNSTDDAIFMHFDVSNIKDPTEIDMSNVIITSKKICNDIKHPTAAEKRTDEKYDSKFVIEPDLINKQYSGESTRIISTAKTEKKDTLTLVMPDKKKEIPNDYNTAASKFLLNFKIYTESLQDCSFVQLIIKSHDVTDKFYYMNKEVDHIYIKKNKWSTLQFEEVRPHRYLINDLDYSEIDWRIKWLHAELSAHEISSYAHIMKLSDDVEFLLSVDRDDMSYKGTLPFLSAKSWRNPQTSEIQYEYLTLSSFIDQSPYIFNHCVKFGDMFKLSATQWGTNSLHDKDGDVTYLGENDYFVINSHFSHISDLLWKDLDLFRNPETETSKLCAELVYQINATSSYLSSEINRISAELSTELSACELSLFNLSISISAVSSDLCSILKLSVDELQRQIVSNDNDIAEISDKVDFLLSVDPEKVSYKGTLPYYRPIHWHDEHNWQLSEYILSALANQRGKYPKLATKQGDLFRVGIAPISAIYDYRKDDNNKIKFGNNDYFIVNKDVKNINDIKLEDIDVIRDAQTEVETLSSELTSQISSISSNISSEIVRISTELSTELSACELSVYGLSTEVDRISTELSTTLKLSVDELQHLIISNDADISEISDKVDFLLSVDPEKVSYKGTVPFYRSTNPTDIHSWQLSEYILSALANQRGKYPRTDLKQGDLFRVGIAPELALFDNRKDISHIVVFGTNDYFIANKDVKNINDIKIEDIDIIRDAQKEVEALSCILADQIDATSSYISAEVNRISAELSTELSACELSVNGLSTEVDRISTELSTTLKLSVDELQNQIVSNDVDISEISAKVEYILSVDQDKVSYKGTIPEYAPYKPSDKYSWQLFEYLANALNNYPYSYPTMDLKKGDLFRVGVAPVSAIYDVRKDDNNTIKFGANDYILINKDVENILYIKLEDIDVIRDAQKEVEALSCILADQIDATSSYISSEVNRISTELSTELSACELSVNGLSTEVDRISTELSTTLKLSVDELQNQIVSNDVDIAEISDKVDFLLSVDPEKVSYKGTVPYYHPSHDHDEYNWQISEYILSALANQRGRYPKLDTKQGDLFRVGIAPISAMYDWRRDKNHKIVFGTNDYILINKDITDIADLIIEDFDILRDAQTEVETLSCDLAKQLNATSSYISAEVNRISAELSTELSACELSVNGLSISIDRLSNELNETSSYLNGQVKEIWNDIRGGVNYKGHLSTFFNNKAVEPEKNPYDLSDLFGYFYNTHGTTAGTIYDEDATGRFIWKNSIPVNNGWMYCVKVDDYTSKTEGQIYITKDGIKLSDRDYIIVHSHELSSVQLSDLTRDTIDIIETQDDDYVRLAKLREVSAWLFNDYTDRDLKLSTALSNEIDKLALSVDGLSNYVDKLELSVDGLSVKTASICSELSIAHNFLSNSLSSEVQKLSTALSNDVDKLSADLSSEIQKLSTALSINVDKLSADLSSEIQKLSTALSNDVDKLSADLSSEIQKLSVALSNEISCDAMHYKGNLIFDPNDNSLTATFIKTFNSKKAVIKLGDIFRFDADHTLESYDYEKNDFIIFTKKTVADAVTSNDFVAIKDYDKEIERQYVKITTELNEVSTIICLSVDGLSNYVDKLELSVDGLSVKTASICSELSIAHNFLSNSLSSEIQKLSATLSVDVKKLSADLSSEIQKLSTSLSNTTKLSVSQLCSEIIANDNDISTISTDLSVLENHYDRTFDEMFYSRGTVGPDLSVDVLNIVDKEETDNQYTLQFLSGTLVLVKKTI